MRNRILACAALAGIVALGVLISGNWAGRPGRR